MKFIVRTGLLVLVAVLTSAPHFGSRPGVGVYRMPDRDMSIRASGLGTDYYKGVEWAVLDYAFNTELNPRLSRGTCDAHKHNRICMFQGNYGDNGKAGWYSCHNGLSGSHPDQTCAHAHIYLNTYYKATIREIKLACHELGHAVGLRHRPDKDTSSCMKQAYPASNTLDGHDRTAINRHY